MRQETFTETEVSYLLEHEGQVILIEHVPARICQETGEQFFAPETVAHIQTLIRQNKEPVRIIETAVYEYV